MTMQQFLKENRQEIDTAIKRYLNNWDMKLNDSERRMWILNDEGLYRWARGEGVNI